MTKPKKIPVREEKDANVQKLKNRIRRLEKENALLAHQVKTLEHYRNITNTYIDKELDGVSIERVIDGVNKKEKLKKISKKTEDDKFETCPSCHNKAVFHVVRHDGKAQYICTKCTYREVK